MPVEERQVIKYAEGSALCQSTLGVLEQCNTCYGISVIGDPTYATYVLVGSRGSNVIHHIPRSAIPDDVFNRLCGDLI